MSHTTVILISVLTPGVWLVLILLFLDRRRLQTLIRETPLRPIRKLERGRVAVKGKVYSARGEALRSPITGTRCLWYSIVVEQLSRGRNQVWSRVGETQRSVEGVLRDRTGECHLDLHHLEHYFPHKYLYDPIKSKQGFRPHGSLRSIPSNRKGVLRYTEYVITPGNTLHVLGICKEISRGHFYLVGTRNDELLVSKQPFRRMLEGYAQRIWWVLILMIVVSGALYLVMRP